MKGAKMTVPQLDVAISLIRSVRQILKDDQAASYPLEKPVSVTIKSRRVAELVTKNVTTKDGFLTVERLDEVRVRVTCNRFPREANCWNGPDVLSNRRLRSMLASLFHDLIWSHRDELSEAWGCAVCIVLRWGNDVLYLVWVWASRDSWWGRREAWLAFQATSFAVPWYHKVKAVAKCLSVLSALALCAAGCSGCYTLPDGEVESLDGSEEVERVMEVYGDGL